MVSFHGPPPRPFLKWVGGKRQLLPELFRAVESAGSFRHYHEPFLGGGALFFSLARTGEIKARSYLSDANKNLIDAYLGVRDEPEAVIERLEAYKRSHSEAHFYKVRASVPRKLVNRAARIIYLNKTCYNGLYRENSKGQFNAPFGRYKNPSICDQENLRAVSQTLQDVDLGVRDFSSVLQIAEPGDLVYFDPPYNPVSKTAGFTAYFRGGFGAEAQQKLAEVCAELAAREVKIILSNSMTDFTRSLYKDFHTDVVAATRMVNSRADRRGKVSEALITSFPLCTEEQPPDKSRVKVRVQRRVQRRVQGRVKKRAASPVTTSAGLGRRLAKQWLLENKYRDVAALIDEITQEWDVEGKQTRRNWWEILAGDAKGNSRVVAGRKFPVLRAAQLRMGVPVTPGAICRNPNEEMPQRPVTGRRRKSF